MSLRRWLGTAVVVMLITTFSIPPFAHGQEVFQTVVQYQTGRLALVPVIGFSADDAATRTRLRPGVRWAEPNVMYHAALSPNDPDYPLQTQLPQIGAPAAWDTRTDASSVIVAVLDSGVDITNPDLTANIWTNAKETAGDNLDNDGNGFVDDVQGWNFIENNNDSRPQVTTGATVAGLNHGTVIAGIIGAQGNNGVAGTGVAWQAKILSVRVLDSTGSGSTVTVAQGIAYAVAAGANIINLSFVGSGASPTLAAAIVDAQAAGVLIVAAAGNENLDLDVTPQYPACYAGVLGVASVSSSDVKSSFSNYGSCIDLAAPGENISSTLFYSPSQGYSAVSGSGWYGTSVASPFVAGAAALLKAMSPTLSGADLATALKNQATNITASNSAFVNDLGAGRLNLQSLLSAAAVASASRVNILAIPSAGDSPRVREYDAQGKLLRQFYTGPSTSRVGASVVAADVNGDGAQEFVTGFQQGAEPRIRIHDRTGKQLRSFLAFSTAYRGGVSLAVGDVTGDGVVDIIVGTDTGSSSVRIFDSTGVMQRQFFAFGQTYRGGVSLAVGEVTGDGVADIVVAKRQIEARVSVFSGTGKLQRSFLVFPTTVHVGVSLAIGDVTGSSTPEIIVGLWRGAPRARVLSSSGKLLREFYAYDKSLTAGVRVSVGDVNGNGTVDIVTGTGPGAKPEVRIWANAGATRTKLFNAYTSLSRTGIAVSTISAL
ncbi:MAG: S8 family serine peptidase [bacterium]|nr:S8 family serine peptidase [bacterium]